MKKNIKYLIIFCLILGFSGCGKKTQEPVVIEEPKVEEKPVVTSASLIAFGDALIHNGVYNDADLKTKNSDGYELYDFNKMFTNIKDIIKDYDLKFYNQETIIGGKNLGLSTYPRFNSPDEIGENLVSMGFNLVNLATNHTLDRGEKAILYSRNFWNNQKDVLATGSYSSFEERDAVHIKEINGIKYTMLSYTTLTNGLHYEEGKDYLVNVFDYEKAKADIAKVRDQVDVLIVSMHWGTEYTTTPTAEEKQIAQFLADNNVDIVLGHHPHCVQPIEYVGNTIVVYSLGNMISAQEGELKRVGLVAALDIKKTTYQGQTTIYIENVRGDLHYTYYQNYRNYDVIPFSRLTNDKLNNYQSVYEKYKKIINNSGDSRITVGFIK